MEGVACESVMDPEEEPVVNDNPTVVPNEYPETYCRFCFSEIDVQPLFSSECNTMSSMLDRLFECIGLRLTKDVDYPSSICLMCSLAMQEFQCFRDRCLKYDEIFRRCRKLNEKQQLDVVEPRQKAAEPLSLDGESSLCQQQFPDKVDLDQHLEQKHKERKRQPFLNGVAPVVEASVAPMVPSVNGTQEPVPKPRNICCAYCPRKFTRQMYYEQHLQKHTKQKVQRERSFRCSCCPRSFESLPRLKFHEKKEHGKKTSKKTNEGTSFVCPECSKSFKYRYSLRMHILNHRGQLPFVCEICDSGFYNVNYLTAHKARYHGPNAVAVVRGEKISCRYCPRSFLRKCDRTSHMKQMHPNIPLEEDPDENHAPEILEECPPADSDGITDPEHLLPNVHEPVMVIKEEQIEEVEHEVEGTVPVRETKADAKGANFYCKICAMEFDTEDMYSEHMDDQHSLGGAESTDQTEGHRSENGIGFRSRKRIIYCQYCPAIFSRPGYLNAHTLRKHPDKYETSMGSYKCRFCPRQFHELRYRKVHERMTHARRGEVLPEMNDFFSKTTHSVSTAALEASSELSNDGTSTMSDLSLLGCSSLVIRLEPLPPKVLATYQWQLDEYDRREEERDVKPLTLTTPAIDGTCSSPAGSSETSDRVDSVRTKLGIKLHPCGKCEKMFKTRQALQKHMMYHIGQLPYRCDECGVQFMRIGQLSFHKSRYHGDSAPTIVNRVSCDYCPRIFLRKQDLASHYFMVHGKDRAQQPYRTDDPSPEQRKKSKRKEYWCQGCGSLFDRYRKCERHIAKEHGMDAADGDTGATIKPIKLCRCSVCATIFKKRDEWLDHLSGHANVRPHNCEQCLKGRKKFGRKQLRFPCNECGVMYDRYRYLAMHKVRYHSEDSSAVSQSQLLKCAFCPRMFTRLRDVNHHQMSVHSDGMTVDTPEQPDGVEQEQPTSQLLPHEFGSLSELLLSSNCNDLTNVTTIKQEFPSSLEQ
ncbi:zinc finger protein 493-like isoform X2 [Anopheles albimanus]|uniref:zinc finger protein 493-like isoform X2 n=1 Tax=Anopheles albimanus TaxID=7167 RepID=UPI0016409433|nr:zinc finger protein 493-like isoform X2 [Anopheles albimanus]